ncbi:MAG: ATP-binding protein, partial [Gammaproteobacteria bacterium]|nr:ATP-binding protein [Gammaproteobacteria bacterium]
MTNKYTMRISRLTVDKLGVKLYDKVSAVIAELISNSYDADAKKVSIYAPMDQYLASKAGGKISDKGLEVKIVDDGIGMTPEEMQAFFLVIGAERRTDIRRGSESPIYKRKVMGRKGVGKLAPFGICKTIEVVSAGGEKTSKEEDGKTKEGFLTSHILLDYDDIVAKDVVSNDDDLDKPYEPSVGHLDGTLSKKSGTEIILKNFNYRRVSNIETLSRQIAQRFGISSRTWEVVLYDNTKTTADVDYLRKVGRFDVTTMPNTRILFQKSGRGDLETIGPDGNVMTDIEAGFWHESRFYELTGWVAYSKEPYKDDLMAGIRIYCRGKIASQTSVFNRRAGFTGEHSIRSYLVGELHADWLDEENDLIQTDRRDVLWSDELGAAFQEWGQSVVKRIGTLSRNPQRKATMEVFFETGDVKRRIHDAYPSEQENEIRDKAMKVVEMLGRTISRGEAEDTEIVGDLTDLSITLAPHITLDESMREAANQKETPMSTLIGFLRTARIAELSSFGRIAEDRLKVIDRLEALKNKEDTEEKILQNLIEDAPWLINPEWAPITSNQSLNTLRKEFEKYYEKKTGTKITLSDFKNSSRKPDFVLSN